MLSSAHTHTGGATMKHNGKFKILAALLAVVIALLLVFSSCDAPFEEKNYTFTPAAVDITLPAVLPVTQTHDALTLTVSRQKFVIIDANTPSANAFVNAQMRLIHHLASLGISAGRCTFVVYPADKNFSDSDSNTAYISMSSARTFKQILVTLQCIYGDTFNYGYLYALSNAIARELNWATDSVPDITLQQLQDYYVQHITSRLSLEMTMLYPCFSTQYVSQETVDRCKALSVAMLSKMDWKAAIRRRKAVQETLFYQQIAEFSLSFGYYFNDSSTRFAYYGEQLPLYISQPDVDIYLGNGVVEEFFDPFDRPIFTDLSDLSLAVSMINFDFWLPKSDFGLSDKQAAVKLYFMTETYSAENFGSAQYNKMHAEEKSIYCTAIDGYLHEYLHFVATTVTGDDTNSWQREAFCQHGRYRSMYTQMENVTLMKEDSWAQLFDRYVGREFWAGTGDNRILYDIICVDSDDFTLDEDSIPQLNSFANYLMDVYGDDIAMQALLHPDKVQRLCGKSWEALAQEWEATVKETYSKK
jgi:hypothetical protein